MKKWTDREAYRAHRKQQQLAAYRKWYKLHKKEASERKLAWQKANPDKANANNRKWRKRNNGKSRRCVKDWFYRANYGTNYDEVQLTLKHQKNCCAICGKRVCGRDVTVDHDHKTGRFRAVLCSGCNTGLGMFQDCVDTLKKAINYLKRHAPR